MFNDSLPDGWGKLLVDRLFKKNKINPAKIDNLNQLAVVQETCMGALTYKPKHKFATENAVSKLDILAQECSKILESQDSDNLDELFQLGGSSGGARPKILTSINNEGWIIKFPLSIDPKNIGEKEWHLSPAYDLTYSSSFNGDHATTINGEEKNPSSDDILTVAKNIGLNEKFAKDIALEIQEKCKKLFD